MRAELLKVPKRPDDSFSVRQDMSNQVNSRWHYHVELELIRFHKGSGTQFVGDNIKRFGPGDIVLVGSNLPHYWRYDEPEMPYASMTESSGRGTAMTKPPGAAQPSPDIKSSGPAPAMTKPPSPGALRSPYSTVIHFRDDLWGAPFLQLPETRPIKALLEKSKRGILVGGKKEQARLGALIDELPGTRGLERLLLLMTILSELACSNRLQLLSSIGFRPGFSPGEQERINAIYDFTFQHFRQNIYLEEVSKVAQLVPNSFCRYFKVKTGKTYSQFVTEIRVGQACQLLIDNKISIKQVCFECGFNNFTSFNQSFKKITGKVPLAYQREYNHTSG